MYFCSSGENIFEYVLRYFWELFDEDNLEMRKSDLLGGIILNQINLSKKWRNFVKYTWFKTPQEVARY